MLRHRSNVAILYTFATLFLVALFSGCAQHNQSAQAAEGGDYTTHQATGEKPTTQYQFTDLPVPVELNLKQDESMLIKTPSYQGGIVTYEGKVTADSLQQYFVESMPKHGWTLQGSLTGKQIFLAFSKDMGAQCLIKIRESTFNTRVEIWLSEPLGATE